MFRFQTNGKDEKNLARTSFFYYVVLSEGWISAFIKQIIRNVKVHLSQLLASQAQ